jgi:hypothetical protein
LIDIIFLPNCLTYNIINYKNGQKKIKSMKNDNSDELKSLLKGKSPEEIAEIVESFYEEKYRKEKLFSNRNIVTLIFFILFLAFILFIFIRLFTVTPLIIKKKQAGFFPDCFIGQELENVV